MPKALVVNKPLEVVQGLGNAGQELGFSFKQSSEAIGSQHLQQANEHISIVLAFENAFVQQADQ